MLCPPISQAELDARLSGHIDELLELWWAEQGAPKASELELIARAIPVPRDQPIRVLDLCSGPGDVGRAIRRIYPHAGIDCLDRDPFLLSICAAVNQRAGLPGRVVRKDLTEAGWVAEISRDYDVVTIVNALHWFDSQRAASVVEDVHGLLRQGGLFILAEPTAPATPFAVGFDEWKATRPPRYTRENWERFWSRANAILGYDHTRLLGARQADHSPSVAAWSRLIDRAGFGLIDVLLKDADQVIIAALK